MWRCRVTVRVQICDSPEDAPLSCAALVEIEIALRFLLVFAYIREFPYLFLVRARTTMVCPRHGVLSEACICVCA